MERKTRSPAAVVIGNHTQGLGIVRSAGVADWTVWVVNDKVLSLTRFSRYLSGYRVLDSGTLTHLDDPASADHLAAVLLGLPVEDSSVLFSVNEDITRFVFRYRERLSAKYCIPDVPLDQIYDKYRFNNLLPGSARIDTRLYSEAAGTIDHPERFVVKGRQGNAFRRLTGEKAIPLSQFAPHSDSVFRQLTAEDVLVQRLVATERPVLSLCSFSIDGQIQGAFQYEKLRQHPNQFGTGTYLRSVSVDDIRADASQVLSTLAFTGISEIEFIHDSASGTYKVIEMNPRTWKSIHFATQCGTNLVDACLAYVASGERRPSGVYVPDRYWTDLATDLPQMIRDRQLGHYHRGFHECSWEAADPVPGLALWTLFPLMAAEQAGHAVLQGVRRRSSRRRPTEVSP